MLSRVGSKRARISTCRAHILVRKRASDLLRGISLATYLHIRINEEIERRPILQGLKINVAAGRELNAIFRQVAEIVFPLVGEAIGFGDVHRDPAAAFGQKPRPAMIAVNRALTALARYREAHLKLGRQLVAASHRNEQAVKVGAVAEFAVAGPERIAAAPTFALLAVLHVRVDQIV